MKQALLLHNTGAGEETHDQEELTRLVENAGFTCDYHSAKEKGWVKKLHKADLLIVAGGDGTVRKAVKALLKKDVKKIPPIGILPFGTANNLSKTVNTQERPEAIAGSWKGHEAKPFDIGWVHGLEEKHFFIEGLGYGIFPTLVRAMKTVDKALDDDPDKKLRIALELLDGIIRNYKAIPCRLEVDGADHSGKYLLVEIMNICSVGPNLMLAPDCVPGDHRFDIVLISEDERQHLLDYISSRLKGVEGPQAFPTIHGRNIRLETESSSIHIDDKLVRVPPKAVIEIELDKNRLQFLG